MLTLVQRLHHIGRPFSNIDIQNRPLNYPFENHKRRITGARFCFDFDVRDCDCSCGAIESNLEQVVV